MRVALTALAGSAILAGPAAPAVAQVAADKSDVRCLLVLEMAGRDPKAREQAAKGAYFYMGRLSSRGPVARLEPIMAGESRTITSAAQAQAELTRCADELNQNQTQFNAVGQKLAASQPAAAAKPMPK